MKPQLLSVALIMFANLVLAFPPTPSEFYGKSFIDGKPAKAGAMVEAYDTDNVLCGRTTITKEGLYGFLSCNGDDPLTARDEGAQEDGIIIFLINGKKVFTSEPALWKESSRREIDLYVGKLPKEIEQEYPSQSRNQLLVYIFFISLSILTFIIICLYICRDKTRVKFVK